MLNISIGGGDNEYQAQAESAMEQARRKRQAGGGEHQPSIIASVLDLLGINHQVGAAPKKGAPTETGDLASKPDTPDSQKVAVMDKKGNVVDTVTQAIDKSNPATQVQPLAMGDKLTLSNDGIPRAIPMIDPNTGRPFER